MGTLKVLLTKFSQNDQTVLQCGQDLFAYQWNTEISISLTHSIYYIKNMKTIQLLLPLKLLKFQSCYFCGQKKLSNKFLFQTPDHAQTTYLTMYYWEILHLTND